VVNGIYVYGFRNGSFGHFWEEPMKHLKHTMWALDERALKGVARARLFSRIPTTRGAMRFAPVPTA